MPLIWLVVAALLGTFLRYYQLYPVGGVDFQHVMHGHSHAAMLGWGYSALFVLIISFIFPNYGRSSFLNRCFWLVQFSVLGMVIAFPLQGYGLWSIIFSTIHLVLFIIIAGWLLKKEGWWYKDATGKTIRKKPGVALFAGFLMMIIASLGPFSLGYLSAADMQNSPLYELSVQFYLHFLIEGWFVLAVLALIFGFCANNHTSLQCNGYHLWGFIGAITLLFGLNIFNYYDLGVWKLAGFAGGVLQMIVVVHFLLVNKVKIGQLLSILPGIMKIALAALLLKFAIQGIVAIPWVDPSIIQLQPIRIGYLHLVLLVFFTLALLSFYIKRAWIDTQTSKMSSWLLKVFVISMIVNVGALFMQGILIHFAGHQLAYSLYILLISSAGMVVGITGILMKNLSEPTTESI